MTPAGSALLLAHSFPHSLSCCLLQYLVAVDPADRGLDADALHHLLLPYGGFVCSYVPDHTYRVAASAAAASKLQAHAGRGP